MVRVFEVEKLTLASWRWPVFITVALFAFIVGILPLILLAVQSIMLIDGFYGLENLTWHFWTGTSNPDIAFGEPGVFHNNNIIGATWNTLKLASLSAVIASIIGLIIAYIVVRRSDNPLANALDQIAFIPFLVSNHCLWGNVFNFVCRASWPNTCTYMELLHS